MTGGKAAMSGLIFGAFPWRNSTAVFILRPSLGRPKL